jgi:hypothetical protein
MFGAHPSRIVHLFTTGLESLGPETTLRGNGNDSKNCYGMLQIGMMVQFYPYENSVLRKLGGKMHLVDDADNIIVMGQHIKDNPMSFV